MIDAITHRWLKVPYTLHVRFVRKPKKPKATVLFIHGIGNTGAAWDEVIERLPNDIRVVSIDLLGFGDSPSPKWALYSAKSQARSVLATYVKLRIMTPVIVVGHSLGSLVAIEMAKRYPLLIKSMILCSPPLYQLSDAGRKLKIKPEIILRKLYQSAQKRPDDFLKISAVAMKYELMNKSFNVTANNVDSYMATLESMIINQTSLDDAMQLKVPTTIIRGTLDPFVVKSNLKSLTKSNKNIHLKSIIAGHEVKGRFVKPVVETILDHLKMPRSGDKMKKQ
jgi:cis-3-alkyl-4-acyloxetan-2-one decarboxylase